MSRVKVEVNLKQNVMDPQGLAVSKALKNMGLDNIKDVRIGKVFHLTFDGSAPDEKTIQEYCNKLLANPVIENFKILEIE